MERSPEARNGEDLRTFERNSQREGLRISERERAKERKSGSLRETFKERTSGSLTKDPGMHRGQRTRSGGLYQLCVVEWVLPRY